MATTDKAKEILERLEAGVAELTSSEDWKRALEFSAKFYAYSFYNTMAIFTQFPDATRVAGFKAWQKLGRQVRKGSKGIAILAPCKVKIKEEERDEKDSSTYKLVGFRAVHVFDVSQTDGDDLPEFARAELLEGEIPDGLQAKAIESIEAAGCSFSIEETNRGNGYYAPSSSSVVVRPGMSDAQTFKTTVHELAHVLLGHGSSLDPRDVAEVEAESTAFVVCSALGIGADEYSIPYVAAWSEGKVETIQKVGERVAKTARKILESLAMETSNEEREEAVA